MVKSLIDPKKKEEVRRALERGDFAKILGKKKELAKPALAVEKPVVEISDEKKEKLNAALFAASANGNEIEVEVLLKAGADVNAKDDGGWTALMHAARWGHAKTAELLIQNKADVAAKHGGGWTARMIASWNKKLEIVELLKRHGAVE